ncbi:hypothetical protein V8F20_002642 [Naviculisporaceae sp. PSN 640]
MITDKDPLPKYGFILAGCLILVILLNSLLGQYLAGWRRPTMGRATARPRRKDLAHWSDTTLNDDEKEGGVTVDTSADMQTGVRSRTRPHGYDDGDAYTGPETGVRSTKKHPRHRSR